MSDHDRLSHDAAITIESDNNRCPPFCGGSLRFVDVFSKTRFRAYDGERTSTVTEIFVDLVYIFCLQARERGRLDDWSP